MKTAYEYTSLSELLTKVSILDTDGVTELSSAEYTYNDGKLLTGITNPSGTVYGFTYDGFGRTLS